MFQLQKLNPDLRPLDLSYHKYNKNGIKILRIKIKQIP